MKKENMAICGEIKEKILHNRQLKIKTFFLIVLLIIFIYCSIFWLPKIDEYIPRGRYDYGIRGDINALEDLNIYHDFSKHSGKITFKINKEEYIIGSNLHIYLPIIIDNNTIGVYIQGMDGTLNKIDDWVSEDSYTENKTVIKFEKINIPFDDEIYYINYTMEIFPHAHFSFHHSNILLNGENPTVSLDLGKDYQCYTPCIDDKKNIEFDWRSTYREIKLELKRDENTGIHYSDHDFTLMAIKDIRIEQGICLGLIVSLLMSFVLISKEILENMEYKKK